MTKEVKPRAVRISISDAVVTFMGKQATLVNISRTGALLRVHSQLPIDAALRDVESRESRRELLDELSSLADEDLEWIEKCWDEH